MGPLDDMVLVDPDHKMFVTLTYTFHHDRKDLDIIPQNLPCFVTLQPGPEDTGKDCGVHSEIQTFCVKSLEKEKSQKELCIAGDLKGAICSKETWRSAFSRNHTPLYV